MAKEVNKENLKKYAEEHLESTTTMLAAGFLNRDSAKGHLNELFYLSATFDLGLQDEAKRLMKEIQK